MYNLHVADVAVLGISVLPVLGLALMCACRKQNVDEFLYGSHALATIPLALSLAGCFITVVNVQGIAAEVYYYGATSAVVLVSWWGPFLAVCLFVSLFYPLKLNSIYQYLDLRFHHSAPKVLALTLGIISLVASACMCAYNVAVTVESVTWVPTWLSMLVITTLCTAITALGGFRAVVWANAFQMFTLLICLIALCCLGALKVLDQFGDDSWDMVLSHEKLTFNTSPWPLDRGSVYQVGAALGLSQMSLLLLQPALMRISAAHTCVRAHVAGLLSILVGLLVTALLIFLGVLMLLYDSGPDCTEPLATNLTSSYQLLYVYAQEISTFPGVTGVYIAAALAITLSTVSNAQSAITTILWSDLLEHISMSMGETTLTCLLRLLTLGVGMLMVSTSLTVKYAGPLFYQIMCLVLTSSGGPVFGLFFAAALFPCLGPWAATLSCLLSCIVCLWLSTGAALYQVTWQAPSLFHACAPNTTVQVNETLAMYSGFGVESGPFLGAAGESYVAADTSCPIDVVYSLSPYMYHVIGFGITLVLALIASLLPCLRQKDTRSKYVFCFVRCCTSSYDEIDDEEENNNSSDSKPKKKREATSISKDAEPKPNANAPESPSAPTNDIAPVPQPIMRDNPRPRPKHTTTSTQPLLSTHSETNDPQYMDNPRRRETQPPPRHSRNSRGGGDMGRPQSQLSDTSPQPWSAREIHRPPSTYEMQPARNSIRYIPPAPQQSLHDAMYPQSDGTVYHSDSSPPNAYNPPSPPPPLQEDEDDNHVFTYNPNDVMPATPADVVMRQKPERPGSMEVNNNMVAYRRRTDPDDPALVLANILQGAQTSGERNSRLSSNTRL